MEVILGLLIQLVVFFQVARLGIGKPPCNVGPAATKRHTREDRVEAKAHTICSICTARPRLQDSLEVRQPNPATHKAGTQISA